MNTGTYTLLVTFKSGDEPIQKTSAYHYDIDFQLDWLQDRLYRTYDFQNIEKVVCSFDGNETYWLTPEKNRWIQGESDIIANYISADELPAKLVENFGLAWMANYQGNLNRKKEVLTWLSTQEIDPALDSDVIEEIIDNTAAQAAFEYYVFPEFEK